MSESTKRLLSGIKPTGHVHLGNYFGAMKQFVALQEEYESFIFIPNYHAITTVHDGPSLQQLTKDVLLDYLAIGLDPNHVTFYLQSDVSAHTELAWIFHCITNVSYLKRAHAYKDARAKGKEINAGTFTYPLLMAADILLYNPDIVPVGLDQKQHVEYARDTAEKFNRIFGETFSLPRAHILDSQSTILGVDGQKMSKSYQNTIPLFDTDENIRKVVFQIVTDSKRPEEPKDPTNDTLYHLLELFSNQEEKVELQKMYQEGGVGYKELKEQLYEKIIAFVTPLREKREKLAADEGALADILHEGGKRANEIAAETLSNVKEKIGATLHYEK